ncbi:alpha/beta fold hydrolase [Nonomuraea sp. NPDC049695]|uniref:thioesterase II family protein n=1 Tax=Nonomuraea sp. NPDC049695 TaxID=3154734 RepID=UPI00343FA116
MTWVQFAKPGAWEPTVLICFHHAGGGASFYRSWPAAFAGRGIEVWPVQLPGRESRHAEARITDLARLIDAMLPELAAGLAGRPYLLYGHSAGALVACAFALAMTGAGLAGPRHVVVGACRPPSRPDPDAPIHLLPPDRLPAKLMSYGGLPPEAHDFPDLVDQVMAAMRDDLRLVETAAWPGGPWLDCPVTAVGGIEDVNVPVDVLPHWREITSGPFVTHRLPGGHFPAGGATQRLQGVIWNALARS